MSSLKLGTTASATHIIDLDITFAPNTTTVPVTSKSMLDKIALYLNTPPLLEVRIVVAGYTDISGSTTTNLRLSQQRADSLRIYLITHGILATRISAVGYGAKNLKYPHLPRDQKNRRVAIVLNLGRTVLLSPPSQPPAIMPAQEPPQPLDQATGTSSLALPTELVRDESATVIQDHLKKTEINPTDNNNDNKTNKTDEAQIVTSEDKKTVETDLQTLATLYDDQGRLEDAEALYKHFLATQGVQLGLNHPDIARCFNGLAIVYDNQGRYPEAESLYKQALAIRERVLSAYHPDIAQSLNNLAEFYRTQEHYAEAEPLYQRALAIREQELGANHPHVAQSLNNFAAWYDDQGRDGEAEPLYQRALLIWTQTLGAHHPNVATVLGNLARLYGDQDRYRETVELIERARTIWIALLKSETLLHENTYSLNRRATAALASLHDINVNLRRRLISDAQTAARSPLDQLYMSVGEIATLRRFMTAESFEIGQLLHDESITASLAPTAAHLALANGPVMVMKHDFEEFLPAWRAADAELLTMANLPSEKYSAVAQQMLSNYVHALSRKLENIHLRIEREFPNYAEFTQRNPVTVEQVQQRLRPDEAMLAYVIGPGTQASYMWLILPNSTSMRRLPCSNELLRQQVSSLRARLDPQQNPKLSAFPVAEAYTLFQELIGPESAQLSAVKTLFIVPDGILERLPFAVLVTEPMVAGDLDYRKVEWLVRHWALASLPTVASLITARSPVSKAHKPFIGFGEPDLSLSMPVPSVPTNANELREIAINLDAPLNSVNLADRNSIPIVRAASLINYQVVAFATPVLISGDFQGLAEPALVFTPPRHPVSDNDGFLRASQIARWELAADWVLLLASNTAALTDQNSGIPGLAGLIKAFFHAGARTVLVSHWQGLSTSNAALITTMLRTGQTHPEFGHAEALRRSMMEFLDTPHQDRRNYHPLIWAPFVVAGN